MQQLTVNITIPDTHVLITKIEYEEMKQNELHGEWWTMADLKSKTKMKSSDWIEKNILYVSKFRKVLDVNNGGFVYYSGGSGKPWSFQAKKMAEFLEKNFADIYVGYSKGNK